MACASCGRETKAGVLFCAGCLSGLTDPLDLLPRLIEPTADARLLKMNSVSMRIFPINGPALSYGAGLDAPLRLPALMEHERISAFPSFVDDYLAGAGVGLHVFGFNTNAFALYMKAGYEITNINMRKLYPPSAVKSPGALSAERR